MASTRSKTDTQGAANAAATDAPRHVLTALARQAIRIQIAACTAAAASFAGWAQEAERFTQVLGDDLIRRVDGESDSAELVARLATATSSHLRELSALPRRATDHFEARLARVPTDN